ncbi:hypothetical protein BN188_280018 [Clostridioides difficile T19]|nr:hypothetical protein BN188_280018 [Clostridioides difficile T19]
MLVCGRGVSEDCRQKKFKTETYQEKVIFKFQFDNFILVTHKAVSLRIDCFFHTQKGVIDLCV